MKKIKQHFDHNRVRDRRTAMPVPEDPSGKVALVWRLSDGVA